MGKDEKGRAIVGNHGVQNVFFRRNLNTIEKRQEFAKKVVKKKIISRAPELSPQKRLEMIERVVKYKQKVAKVCLDFNISRPVFYKWLKRYQAVPEDEKLQALGDKEPVIKRYYRQTPEKYEEAVLSVAAQYPELGIKKIVAVLPRIADKPIVGYHGVQNVLNRHNLNTYEQRLAYARTQVTPITRLIGAGQQIFAKLFALPTVTRQRLVRLSAIGAFACFLTVAGLGILGYFGTALVEAPTAGSRIGLVFATIALVVGSVFFGYSMKYYFSLALVLSFSRRSLEEQEDEHVLPAGARPSTGQARLPAGQGWLKRIFGLNGNGNGHWPVKNHGNGRVVNGNGNGSRRAGGLQPNLDHIKLKRFPFFSIHLPFYNEKRVAKRIMEACMGMDYPNYEVIVCDDSNDETVDMVLNYQKKLGKVKQYKGKDGEAVTVVEPKGKPTLKVIHRQTRAGFKGKALSYALQNIDPQTEFVCVFDADFIPYPDTLRQFLKYYKATGAWEEKKSFQAQGVATMPYDTNEKVPISSKIKQALAKQVEKIKTKSNTAVVAGYQWHVLNKSENWITRGVRTEYAGSYVVERPGQEILGAMKIIHGSVYCIRADVLKHFGWGTSITEDYELTLRIYEKGFKVVFTPYIQAPSECVSTLKRLIRQRMRWAEGHSYCTKKQFRKLIFNPNLTLIEKLEFLYFTPYYFQAAFFIVGTFAWLISETVFKARLPFWTALWGWSLVLTNFFALPLVNGVGLFLEESEERDYLGLLSFVALCYLVVPFQAYAAVKGFLEPKEGTWFRTPKSGKITDIFTRGKFYRWITGILPGRRPAAIPAPAPAAVSLGRPAPAFTPSLNRYLALSTANNQFNHFNIKPKRLRWVSKAVLAILLCLSVSLFSLTHNVSQVVAAVEGTMYVRNDASTLTGSWLLSKTADTDSNTATVAKSKATGNFQYQPGTTNTTSGTPGTITTTGWLSGDSAGVAINTGTWGFTICETDDASAQVGYLRVLVWKVQENGTTITASSLIYDSDTAFNGTDIWDGAANNNTFTSASITGFTFDNTNPKLYVEYWNIITTGSSGAPKNSTFVAGTKGTTCSTSDPQIVFNGGVVIPEKLVFLIAAAPFIPMIVLWMKKQKERLALNCVFN